MLYVVISMGWCILHMVWLVSAYNCSLKGRNCKLYPRPWLEANLIQPLWEAKIASQHGHLYVIHLFKTCDFPYLS